MPSTHPKNIAACSPRGTPNQHLNHLVNLQNCSPHCHTTRQNLSYTPQNSASCKPQRAPQHIQNRGTPQCAAKTASAANRTPNPGPPALSPVTKPNLVSRKQKSSQNSPAFSHVASHPQLHSNARHQHPARIHSEWKCPGKARVPTSLPCA